jgi:hypothetical protein
MGSQTIPKDVKVQVEEIVRRFNQETLGDGGVYYVSRFRGRFLYLDRYEFGRQGQICRLTYTGEMDEWEFAIFKWSDERYDPDEWMFPGVGHLDGTVEGAMKAGLEAYPA